jgi:large subunit ribosomal protein L29
MAVGTKELAAVELRGFDDERLLEELRKAKEELFNLRFQSATGQLGNHGRLRAVKKDIARIYTEMRERELGITTPVPTSEAAAAVRDAKADKRAARAARKAEKAQQKAVKAQEKAK